MILLMRTPETCSFRRPNCEGSVCNLLRSLLKADDDAHVGLVSEDACHACCKSQPPPNEIDLNPVLASLLFGEADRLMQLPDCGGCSRDTVEAALKRSEANIPMLLPDETETAPVALGKLPDDITVSDIERIIPIPSNRDGREEPIHWAVGVTTAPRRQPTLQDCLDTLLAAGWDSPRLFVDGQVELPAMAHSLQQTVRAPQQGAWLNYYLTLQELLEHTDADVLMLVQDDAAFPPTSAIRHYLDCVVTQTGTGALLSLYCPTDYDGQSNGWQVWDSVWHFGALAFVWSRPLAEAFVADSIVAAYENPADGERKAGIDVVIGEWAKRAGVSIYRSTPSIVQHIGHVSSIWETSRAVGLRRATSYVGDFLKQQ